MLNSTMIKKNLRLVLAISSYFQPGKSETLIAGISRSTRSIIIFHISPRTGLIFSRSLPPCLPALKSRLSFHHARLSRQSQCDINKRTNPRDRLVISRYANRENRTSVRAGDRLTRSIISPAHLAYRWNRSDPDQHDSFCCSLLRAIGATAFLFFLRARLLSHHHQAAINRPTERANETNRRARRAVESRLTESSSPGRRRDYSHVPIPA